eukprot:2473091-Amphidinium_carterae.1
MAFFFSFVRKLLNGIGTQNFLLCVSGIQSAMLQPPPGANLYAKCDLEQIHFPPQSSDEA